MECFFTDLLVVERHSLQKSFVKRLDLTYLIKPSDLSSIYVSGGEGKIGELFKDAEENRPSVICFDEVESLMPKRDGDSHQAISSRVNEFLAQINNCSDRGIFIIATTNQPNLIDKAILRVGRLKFTSMFLNLI